LLKQYSGVEKLTGDAGKGMTLFRQQCATCHKLRGEGSDVGPDLATLAGKDVQTLLVAILDPNQTVEVRYVNYTALTKDEREISGILTAETANSITLRAPGGREETLLRSDLSQFTSSGLSLMPDGFEKALTSQDMADLLAALLGK
jgi:putative heme-binding domain-containing protein